jgi:hypothetical protein
MSANTTLRFLACSMTVLSVAGAAQAQDAPVVEVHGFAESDVSVPITGYAPEADAVTVGLTEAEVDIIASPTETMIIRTDMNWFPSLDTTRFDDLIEQAYFDYSFGPNSGGFIAAGKINAPIGAELIDSIDRFQISQGQIFAITDPFNLTGVFGGYRANGITAIAWISNNWDLPTTPEAATAGGRFDYAFDAGHVGVATSYGPIVADQPYLLLDVDTGLTFGNLNLLGEVNFGTSESIDSIGFSATANYGFTDMFSGTIRADYLSRETQDVVIDTATVTLAGLLDVTENLRAAAEVRAWLPSGGETQMLGQLQLIGHF